MTDARLNEIASIETELDAALYERDAVRERIAVLTARRRILLDEVERKAARAIGVSRTELQRLADETWGRTFIGEREHRLNSTVRNVRSMQAARGHVTRSMLTELREAMRDEDE